MLDVDGSHVLSFRSVAWLFGVLCSNDFARKLRLFYYLHLAFPPSLDEVDRPIRDEQNCKKKWVCFDMTSFGKILLIFF